MALAGRQDEVAAAFVAAREAGRHLAATPVSRRVKVLRDLRRALVDAADEVAATITEETGKPLADAFATELLPAQLHLRWLERHATGILAPQRVSSWPQVTKRTSVHRAARGVAGVIAPGNFPFLLALIPTATALAAGCPVVVKPSEHTPRSGVWLQALGARTRLPTHAITVVTGDARVGSAVVEQADVVAFTGSSPAGRSVAAQAGRRLIPAVLELGGNDAMLVLDDADVRRAARTAVWGAFLNAGQSCVAVERVYVTDATYDAFLAAIDDAIADVDASDDPRRGIGPLAGGAQARLVEAHLRDAVDRGATIRHGGSLVRKQGRAHMEPTVLTDVPDDAAMLAEETFGPLLPIMRVADEADAVRRANDCPYGLSASVWTRSRDRGRAVAAALEVGSVTINDALVTFGMPAAPFGGRGASGLGRLGGSWGLRAFSHEVTLTETRIPLPREVQWFPRVLGTRTARTLVRLLGR